jgi:hypothetical protein
MTREEILDHILLRASGIGQAPDYSYEDFYNEMVEMQRTEKLKQETEIPNLMYVGAGRPFAQAEAIRAIVEQHPDMPIIVLDDAPPRGLEIRTEIETIMLTARKDLIEPISIKDLKQINGNKPHKHRKKRPYF